MHRMMIKLKSIQILNRGVLFTRALWTVVLVCWSIAGLSQLSPRAVSARSKQKATPSKDYKQADLSHMSSTQLANYVFENHGCKSCHTMGKYEKFGFTERGKEVGKNFEGCISLLTAMNVIAQTTPADRTKTEKQKAARFQEFGCTTCHQITPGKLGLTNYGRRLKSMHMACTDVEKIIASDKSSERE
jgi:cytochrome c551/c552